MEGDSKVLQGVLPDSYNLLCFAKSRADSKGTEPQLASNGMGSFLTWDWAAWGGGVFYITGVVKIQKHCPENPTIERQDGIDGLKRNPLNSIRNSECRMKVIVQTKAWYTYSFNDLKPASPILTSQILSQQIRYHHRQNSTTDILCLERSIMVEPQVSTLLLVITTVLWPCHLNSSVALCNL